MTRWFPLAAGFLFAVAHTQSPLYYSNQNQYFLHGLAAAGYGHLNGDWLANTADPTPAFSAFVAAAHDTVGDWAFQAVFFLALVGYFVALWELVAALPAAPVTAGGRWAWAAGMIAAHAGIVRWASDRLLGADYPWFLQCGVANQYVLGPGLQPSVVGVLLVAAVAAYARGRPVLAAGLAAGANAVHSTYLLPAGMLVAGFVAGEWADRRWRAGLLAGGVALLLVAPVVGYTVWRFGPSDPAAFHQAQYILADVRIPHHARPARWFDWVAAVQVGWVLLGLVALRRTRLFVPLGVAAGLAAAGTGVVVATDNPTAALLFPWRVSAVLVPVATAVLLARLARRAAAASPVGWVVFCIGLSFAGAAAVYGLRLGYREPVAEDPALAFVRGTAVAGEVYLAPARFPRPTTARGVDSATFAPPPDPTAPVYFEMARFRLATGAPLYIDFKAIPYAAADVLEWDRRVAAAERWFADPDWDRTGVIDEVVREGVTHVVAPAKLGLRSARLHPLFEGGAYRVYRIR